MLVGLDRAEQDGLGVEGDTESVVECNTGAVVEDNIEVVVERTGLVVEGIVPDIVESLCCSKVHRRCQPR